ncbi:MAG TPA: proton-conducting transporter membrane subunit [Feifaniaceae bacterium]|nr:proton-conducting transporter membrane subunit [Feifaniaceae bacterium]
MLLFLAMPLAAVVVLNIIYYWIKGRFAVWCAAAVALAQTLLSGYVLFECLKTGAVFSDTRIGLMEVDSLSAMVLLTVGLIGFVSLLITNASIQNQRHNFANLTLILMAGMNGVALVRDLFTLYVFIEITSAASFILIGFRRDRNELEGAFKYYIQSTVATIAMLTATAFVFLFVGDTTFTNAASAIGAAAQAGAFPYGIVIALILYTVGFAIKSGAVPFHAWVPDAYSASSAPVSVLLSGVVTKASGVYVLMRIFRDIFLSHASVGRLLTVLGLISILVGAFAAIGQNKMKRMLAFSSVSQIGYILLGLGTGSALGFFGAMLHFFNHASFKSLLFLDAAAVEQQTGLTDMDEMGGLSEKMPVTGWSSVIAYLSTAGIPPLAGFWSKLFIIVAVWRVSPAMAIIALLAGVITLAYLLLMQKKVFFGKVPDALAHVKEAGAGFVGAELLLAAVNVLGGAALPFLLGTFKDLL